MLGNCRAFLYLLTQLTELAETSSSKQTVISFWPWEGMAWVFNPKKPSPLGEGAFTR